MTLWTNTYKCLKDPNDILTDNMTDYDRIKKLEQAIQSGASDE